MTAILFCIMLLGCLVFMLGLTISKLSMLKKYGVILFLIGTTILTIRGMLFQRSQATLDVSQSTQSEPITTTPTFKEQVVEANNVVENQPVKEPQKEIFDWDAFDASPERAELSDNVIAMQNNKLKHANFLPFNGKDTGLGDFMKSKELKFTDVSLDCFSSDTECKLHVHITRKKYPSKVDGYICGAVAYWTAPYTNLKKWTPSDGMALPPLLYEGNEEAVLRKIDYEYERRC